MHSLSHSHSQLWYLLSKPNWTSTSIQQEFELDYILTARSTTTTTTTHHTNSTSDVRMTSYWRQTDVRLTSERPSAPTPSLATSTRPGPPCGLSLRGELLLEAVLPSDWLQDTILELLRAKRRKWKWLRHRLRLLVKIFQLSFIHCINNLGYSFFSL